MVRVKKVEDPSGTYYIPQARRWKTRWLGRSGYKWEYFKIQETYYGERSFIYRSTTTSVSYFYDDKFKGEKGLKLAEYYCKEYVRVHYSDEVVKVWSIEDE